MRGANLLGAPLRAVLQLVVQQLHGLPAHGGKLVSHQALHHRDEGVSRQQGVDLATADSHRFRETKHPGNATRLFQLFSLRATDR